LLQQHQEKRSISPMLLFQGTYAKGRRSRMCGNWIGLCFLPSLGSAILRCHSRRICENSCVGRGWVGKLLIDLLHMQCNQQLSVSSSLWFCEMAVAAHLFIYKLKTKLGGAIQESSG
jgi:hypothetical protein